MIDLVQRYAIPQAYTLLPPQLKSDRATAMLLAIGLQESRFLHRRQVRGPARGFWQFERAGVLGVLTHRKTDMLIASAMHQLRYDANAPGATVQKWLEHNDVLAACFARCLLWASPLALPASSDPEVGWIAYERNWRPGRPHPTSWTSLFNEAWQRVDPPPQATLRA